jgi:hypothetical protein
VGRLAWWQLCATAREEGCLFVEAPRLLVGVCVRYHSTVEVVGVLAVSPRPASPEVLKILLHVLPPGEPIGIQVTQISAECDKKCPGRFVVHFTTPFSVTRLYSVDDRKTSEWCWIGKDLVGNSRGLMLMYYLWGAEEDCENLNQVSRSPGPILNPRPPEYKAGVLTTRPRSSVSAQVIVIRG